MYRETLSRKNKYLFYLTVLFYLNISYGYFTVKWSGYYGQWSVWSVYGQSWSVSQSFNVVENALAMACGIPQCAKSGSEIRLAQRRKVQQEYKLRPNFFAIFLICIVPQRSNLILRGELFP
jgi:hypothetical protein